MKHIKQLDGLRFIAIFLVLLQHFAFYIGNRINAGYYGVDLFFVISGFLITTILYNSKESFWPSYKKFLGRRTLRIFPLYYATIIILFCLNFPYVREYILYLLTYTHNFAIVYFKIPSSHSTHFWSLSVEEQFYLFWPFLILGLRTKMKLLKVSIIALIIFCAAQVVYKLIPALTPYNYYGLIPRAYSLAMGGLGAILFAQGKIPLSILRMKWLEPVVVVSLMLLLFFQPTIKLILLPIISIYLILKTAYQGFSFNFINKFLSNNKITYIGAISYGIYIFHLPLAYYLTTYVFDPFIWKQIDFSKFGSFAKIEFHSWVIKLPLYSLISIGVAHLSFKYFEKPILGLKDKLFKYND